MSTPPPRPKNIQAKLPQLRKKSKFYKSSQKYLATYKAINLLLTYSVTR